MGNWKVSAIGTTGPGGGPETTLFISLRIANRLWAELNQARAELGLPPLGLDQRPAYDKWAEVQKHPDKVVPVYPR